MGNDKRNGDRQVEECVHKQANPARITVTKLVKYGLIHRDEFWKYTFHEGFVVKIDWNRQRGPETPNFFKRHGSV